MKKESKMIKQYRRYLIMQKGKRFVLSTLTVAVLVTTPFILNPIDSLVIEKKVENVKEVTPPKTVYTALEVEKKANMLYFFDHNIYAKAITNSILMECTDSEFEVVDPVTNIQDESLVVKSPTKEIIIEATSDYFALKYKYPVTRKETISESLTYMYGNDRKNYNDIISREYVDKYGVLKVSEVKSYINEQYDTYSVSVIKTDQGVLRFYDNHPLQSFLLLDGVEYILNEDEYHEIRKLYNDAVNGGTLDIYYSLIFNKYQTYTGNLPDLNNENIESSKSF